MSALSAVEEVKGLFFLGRVRSGELFGRGIGVWVWDSSGFAEGAYAYCVPGGEEECPCCCCEDVAIFLRHKDRNSRHDVEVREESITEAQLQKFEDEEDD